MGDYTKHDMGKVTKMTSEIYKALIFNVPKNIKNINLDVNYNGRVEICLSYRGLSIKRESSIRTDRLGINEIVKALLRDLLFEFKRCNGDACKYFREVDKILNRIDML